MSAPVYCWNLDGEEFHGSFDSREAALAEGQAEAENEWPYDHTGAVYTGEQCHALHFLRKREQHIGVSILEDLDEWLADVIPSDDTIVDLSQEKHAAFGKHILDWLEQHASFNRWAVVEVREHEYTTPKEECAK